MRHPDHRRRVRHGRPFPAAHLLHATYGINYYELGKTTAAMAVKVLKGEAEPASMPIEYQTDEGVLEVAINTETADKLGITIPDDVKSTATLLP